MKVRAAVVDGPGGEFLLRDVELDGPRDDEVLVRLVATGLCHTDLSIRTLLPSEMFPRVLGHEGAGVVEAIGPEVSGIAVGDHVVMTFRSCQACGPCRAGAPSYCDLHLVLNYMGFRMDGSTVHSEAGSPVQGSFFGQSSLATYAIGYADNCVVIDPDLDLAIAAPYGCGFQTGAGAVMQVLQPRPDQSIAVFGAGAVGLAAVAAASAIGAAVVAIDVVPERLALAADLGALTVNAGDVGADAVVATVKELTGGGPMGAIDTSAIPAVAKQAQQCLATRGTLVLLGLGPEEWVLDATDLLAGGKTVRSSIEGDVEPKQFIPRLLELRAQGKFNLDHLVVRYDADRINEAARDAEAGRSIKPVIVW